MIRVDILGQYLIKGIMILFVIGGLFALLIPLIEKIREMKRTE